ncbi:uncharacterized protein FYW47_001785 [Aplochiton taeniatus]
MSHKQPGEGLGEAARGGANGAQPNGAAVGEPVRRSWRPCQMLHQDEQNPHGHHHHHHASHQNQNQNQHHPPAPRGPPRHRRRPPSGQGQGQVPSKQGGHGEVPDMEQPRPTQHPRPGVTRYRRHGDPNPRVRGHRQRLPREMHEDPPLPQRHVTETEQDGNTHLNPLILPLSPP